MRKLKIQISILDNTMQLAKYLKKKQRVKNTCFSLNVEIMFICKRFVIWLWLICFSSNARCCFFIWFVASQCLIRLNSSYMSWVLLARRPISCKYRLIMVIYIMYVSAFQLNWSYQFRLLFLSDWHIFENIITELTIVSY